MQEMSELGLSVCRVASSADGCDYVEADAEADLSPEAGIDDLTPGYMLDIIGAMAEFYDVKYWIVTAFSTATTATTTVEVSDKKEVAVTHTNVFTLDDDEVN